jgi:hypothetical protein
MIMIRVNQMGCVNLIGDNVNPMDKELCKSNWGYVNPMDKELCKSNWGYVNPIDKELCKSNWNDVNSIGNGVNLIGMM